MTDHDELLASVDYWLEGGIPPMGVREMVVKMRAALAARPEPEWITPAEDMWQDDDEAPVGRPEPEPQ